jgi:hypothetical protein
MKTTKCLPRLLNLASIAGLLGSGFACTLSAATIDITAQPQPANIFVGHTLQLTVGVTGANPTYHWWKDAAPITGANALSYVLPNAQTTDGGGYSVIISNADGAVTSTVAQVTVQALLPLTDQMAGYWKLDEIAGTVAADSSGGGHDGVVINNAGDQWAGGRVGGAMNFRGPDANDYIAVTNVPMPAGNSFSLAFWVYREPTMLISDAWRMMYFTGLDGPFSLRDNPGTGQVRPGVYQANSNLVTAADPVPLPESTWTHYVMLADGAKLRVYRNGAEVASAAYDGTLRKSSSSSAALTIGGFFNPGLTGKFWQGKFDDIGYWTRALSPEEVQLVYAAGFGNLAFADLGLGAGQISTNWVAYNDLGANYTTPTADGWVTAPCVSGNDFGMVSGQPPMAIPLTNYPVNQYPVAELPPCFSLDGRAQLTMIGNGTSPFTVPAGNGLAYPFPGSPGYDLFHGIVDMGNVGSLYGVGAAQYVLHVFTNLNPAARYSFRGTVTRGGNAIGTHDIRWTLCSITGARSFTDAHTPGTLTASTVLTGLVLTNGQVAFQSGFNTNGQVVGWDDIQPAPDGSFTVVNQPYNGVTDHDNASGNLGYILAAVMLTEQSTLGPVLITTPLAATNGALQNLPFSLRIQASGTAPQYQWYKEGEGAIEGATLPTYGKPLATLADSGTYYVVVYNRFGSVTNSTYLDVVNDTTPPVLTHATGDASLSRITLEFSEVMAPDTVVDTANYTISPDGINPLSVASLVVTNNNSGTVIILTTEAMPENTLYTVQLDNVTDLAGNLVANTIQFRSWTSMGANRGLVFEYFPNTGGGVNVADLTNNAVFPNNPTAVYQLTNFNTREVFPDNSHEGYGGRVYGLFVPSVSGLWRFYVHSDDASALYLNPTGPSPAGKILIAQETACCNAYTAPPSPRTSAAISLIAGQAYYIEGIYKEGGGGDYIQVAARLDGTGLPSIGANADPFLDVETIPGSMLGVPYLPVAAGGTIVVSQAPTNMTVDDNGQFAFSIAATSSSGLPLRYQWSRWDDVSSAFLDIPGATGPSYSGFGTLADTGARFRVNVTLPGLAEGYEAVLTVQADTTPPKLLSARGSEFMDKITLFFSEQLDPSGATDTANYELSGGLTVQSAVLSPDLMTVTLQVTPDAPLLPNAVYTVTANVADKAGNAAVAPDNTATLRSFVLSRGFLNFAYYDTSDASVGTDCTAQQAVSVLTSHPSYPDHPTFRAFVSAFTSRLVLTDSNRERFGARFTGVFIPPVSGNWLFYASADDDAELWLNPNGPEPGGATLLFTVPSCCAAPSAHGSAAIPLTAGQAYFIQGLYKEGCGGDYMYVVAKPESDPTSPDSLAPISGDSLGCFVDPTEASLSVAQQPANVTVVLTQPLIEQNFKTSDGGYTAETTGTSPAGGWAYDAAGGFWYANGDDSGPTTSTLTGPAITVSQAGPLVLSFSHRYSFEFDGTRWDGGQVRISVNGGPFTPVPSNSFTANGYVGLITGNHGLTGQWGFNGPSPGTITSVANLGNFAAGDTLAIQFVGGWDEGTTATQPNWVINSILLISQQSVVQDFGSGDGSFVANTTGTTPAGGWTYDATGGFWAANGDDSGPTTSTLDSPAITILNTGSFSLTFKHRYNFEYDGTRWDGGQVRISVNGGAFTTVPSINFSSGGYDGIIAGTGVLNQQPGFNGASAGYAETNYVTSTAFLGGFAAGDLLVVQFVGAWDEGTAAAAPDWVIKSFAVVQGGAEPATFHVTAQATTPGQTNPIVAYQWQRDDGDGFVSIVGANQATLSFLPGVSDNLARFRCVLTAPGVIDPVVSEAAILTVVGGIGPVLRLEPSAPGSLTFSWPLGAADYVLQEATVLKTTPETTAWGPSGETKVVGSSRITVTVQGLGTQKFYRLSQ